MKIHPHDLSIVFQGSIGKKGTPERLAVHRALQSAMEFFPGAELILSTWRGSVDEEFTGATVIECEDPGPIACAGGEIINTNRQIVSSREGVRAASRAYVMKTRTDTYFTHGHMLKYFDKVAPPRNQVSKARILVVNFTSRNPHSEEPYPFTVCDWLYLGAREDIVALFALPNYPAEYAFWFPAGEKPANDPNRAALCRYYAETYIWLSFVRRALAVDSEHSSDTRPHLLQLSEQLVAENLIMLDKGRAGIDSAKHKIPFAYHRINYTYAEWRALLERFGVQTSLPRVWLDAEKMHTFVRDRLRPMLLRVYQELTRPYRKLKRVLAGEALRR